VVLSGVFLTFLITQQNCSIIIIIIIIIICPIILCADLSIVIISWLPLSFCWQQSAFLLAQHGHCHGWWLAAVDFVIFIMAADCCTALPVGCTFFSPRVLNLHGYKKLILQYCGYGNPP